MGSSSQSERIRLRIAGSVQGVGFRPFVFRLASELGLGGYVLNDSHGVTVEVQGSAKAVRRFVERLQGELPPLASIDRIEQQPIAPHPERGPFVIRPSEGGELADAQVTVDTAVCADCLREMTDPSDPRYGYPFINCTNCGPRYTIVRGIPYDRPNTTMAQFAMCPLCRREYDDPSCRRFHAQPIACPRCGPKVSLVEHRGEHIAGEPVARAAALLRAGRIVAIKGLGGFHLACRADDDHAVRRMRRRKNRDAKPFAVMVRDLAVAARYAHVGEQARQLLTGIIRPIVLLDAKEPEGSSPPIAPSVAQGLRTVGIMLPYAPLHHLLFSQEALADLPLVMTSGNYSEEPLVKDNDSALAHLGAIADALLLHDRPIERRLDDSVVQMHYDGHASVLRRARGYAPTPVTLAGAGPSLASGRSVLAVGPELKNTICLLRGDKALLSEHIGDLKDGRAYRHFVDTINHLEELFEVRPDLIAADLHPQYLSTQYALRRHKGELAGRKPLPIVRVQHHHAHIVACMAENGHFEPVIGLACDGVGLGEDGAVWGCEVLRAEVGSYVRLGHLRYVPLPGGDAAALETARPALAALWDTFGHPMIEMDLGVRLAGGPRDLETVVQMLAAGVNCPPSSSLGRWFDAVAAMCGIAGENAFEGQAPMLLEAAIAPGVENAYEFKIIGPDLAPDVVTNPERERRADSAPPFQIDLRPMVGEIVNDLSAGYDAGVIAARFHNTVAGFLLAGAIRARGQTDIRTVALSGGCFANRYLTARLARALEQEGFEVLLHRTTPCNDGCVALGQAIVAAATLNRPITNDQ